MEKTDMTLEDMTAAVFDAEQKIWNKYALQYPTAREGILIHEIAELQVGMMILGNQMGEIVKSHNSLLEALTKTGIK